MVRRHGADADTTSGRAVGEADEFREVMEDLVGNERCATGRRELDDATVWPAVNERHDGLWDKERRVGESLRNDVVWVGKAKACAAL